VNNDAMATAQLMGTATERINVGTWIANVYLRHPYVCAQGASFIASLTGGRFILGLGVSHQPVNGALKIDMSNAAQEVRRYTTEVQAWLRGDGPATHLPQQPASHKVPVYVAAVTSRMVEQAAELADGIMPIFWSPARVRQSKIWVERGRAKAPERGKCDVTLGIPGLSAMTSRRCVRLPARISSYTPTFRFSNTCSAPAASPPRRTRWSAAQVRTHSATSFWTRSV
jgi:alkanesulfonate monooxygenase SsuD/methylene tetrahydromethanopterin reductase-like flavin-dependent oxidoreductase (luciferase family)